MPLGYITLLDRDYLATCCEAHSLRVKAVQLINKHGPEVSLQQGYVNMWKKATETYDRYAVKLGLNPSDRGKIEVPPHIGQTDDDADLALIR